MPPVPTKPKLKDMSSRRDLAELECDGSDARRTKRKRNKGQESCAECRRLKKKCDKQVPCQSCHRRGCAALCPNGILPTGKGTRSVVAAMEDSHCELTKTRERVRKLEDALSELQAKHSTEPHPLLRSELLGASQHDDVGPPSTHDPAVAENTHGLVEALGTLSISDSGVFHFFGPTGSSQVSITPSHIDSQDCTNNSSDSARGSKSLQLPQEIENLSRAFPFAHGHLTLNVENLVKAYLPTWQRARYLAEVYLDQGIALSLSVSKDQILSELLPAYYTNGVRHVTQAGNNPHQLSLLLLIFAIGALLDPKQAPGNVWAELYHQVARAAFCLRSMMDEPSLETILALRLLSIYNAVSGNELAGKETSIETSWSLVSLTARIALRVLSSQDRDDLKFGLFDDITTPRRQVVFWELFVADVWNSLDAGRPPTLFLSFIDCQFPGGGSPHDKVHIGSDSGSWVFRFASYCVADVAVRTLTFNPPNYDTILELDRKVSNFPITTAAEEFATAACGENRAKLAVRDVTSTESVIRLITSNAREVRDYFVQAIVEYPTNPQRSSYARSFLASYRASLTILRTIKLQYDLHPKLTASLWPIWTYAFSAAIVFGTIVTHSPRSPTASDAMKELRDAHLLFSKASSRSRRAQEALPIITKLVKKAENALDTRNDVSHELGQQWDDPDDTAAIFAGRTKIVYPKRQTTEVPTSDRTPYPGASSQSTLIQPSQAPPQMPPHVPYNGEQSGSTWLQQPGFAAALEPTQEVPTSDRTLYSDIPSWPTLIQPSRAPQQISLHVPCSGEQLGPTWLQQPGSMAVHGEPVAGPSTGPWQSELSDPAGAYHHQSHPEPHTSTYPHTDTQPQPLPCQLQPTHWHPPQSQPSPPAPPKLTQLGLVPQGSGLAQQWTSFMRDSGFFDGFD
ncbi:hypothetical protein EDC04DRAFT_2586959 [Pisolithus marmoratus]|nr:hypothetical protein EDC04DRAFT_2586959 [Pisolithus marmoratus]